MLLKNVYLGLGANLGQMDSTFNHAIELINSKIGAVVKVSSFYHSLPLNPPKLENFAQPEFLNAALHCQTMLSAEQILEKIIIIEADLGLDRKNKIHWGPRMIDIDILFIDQEIIETEKICVPHRHLQDRDFVLIPLNQIAPDLLHPCYKKTINQLLNDYKSKGLPVFVK